jgi:enoyl-CoA hydratase/carnithine racemase
MKTVNFQQSGSHAILRFNRPHRLNAVTEEVYGDLGRALDDALDNPSIQRTCWPEKAGRSVPAPT